MSRLILSLFAALSLSAASTQAARDPLLVILQSDMHSHYENVENYLLNLTRLIQQFRVQHPQGKVLIQFNGDIAGTSQWTDEDQGNFSYRLMVAVSTLADYAIATLGNHEGFDVIDPAKNGNRYFLEQTRAFLKLAKSTSGATLNSRLLVANFVPLTRYQDLFEPFLDFEFANRKARNVGLTLIDFYPESTYTADETPIFRQKQPRFDETLKQSVIQAARDGIEFLFFSAHENSEKLKEHLEKLLEWKKTRPELDHVQIPLMSGAHRHQLRNFWIGSTGLVEADWKYAFSTILIDENGKIIPAHDGLPSQHFVAISSQNTNPQPTDQELPEALLAVLNQARSIIAEVQKINSEVLVEKFEPRGIIEAIPDLTDEHALERWLGRTLATTLEQWVRSQMDLMTPPGPIAGVVGMVNKLSYKAHANIPEIGSLLTNQRVTTGTVKALLPYDGFVSAIAVKGSTLRDIHQAIHDYGQSVDRPFETPEISWGLDLNTLDPDATYLLITDHWLAKNGYQIPALDTAYEKILWRSHRIRLHEAVALGFKALWGCQTPFSP